MMNQEKENPEIKWKILNNKEYLYFTFHDTLREKEASDSVIKWHELLNLKNEKRELIWNCLDMKGYEPMARIIWQRAIKELKTYIDKIWLISDSTLIQTGARIMSLFTSFDLKVVKSESDIGN